MFALFVVAWPTEIGGIGTDIYSFIDIFCQDSIISTENTENIVE